MDQPRSNPLSSVVRPTIYVTFVRDGTPELTLKFYDRFLIGNSPDCEVVLQDTDVSAVHAEVWFEKGSWWLRDKSGKGETYLNGQPIDTLELESQTQILFGMGGQVLMFDVQTMPHHVLTKAVRQAFRAGGYVPVGEHRLATHRLLTRFLRMQARKYSWIIAVLAVVTAGAGGYAYIKHRQVEKQQALAQDVFYEMKEFELALARLEQRITERGDTLSRAELLASRSRLSQLNATYDKYVSELGVYKEGMDEGNRTILRVARVFGECELTMPPDFVGEVKRYIGLWKLSSRLARSLDRAEKLGYSKLIARTLMEEHMPPQFFFLALQESEFDSAAVGPPTDYGIAKGMWQFIPMTATQYGLKTGPLKEFARMDPRDERHRVVKASRAAAKYIRDIYNTEAQASGLLVMASYNWGHNTVKKLVRQLPENPRERNFWKFLAAYKGKIPKQTYDYVFMIVSAACICENPGLFGFSFPKPLSDSAL
jgi:pSer/pThr/pTyr-binding forkhead associated (FHA) protein/soluble lytic murein transglycosylase-like protein